LRNNSSSTDFSLARYEASAVRRDVGPAGLVHRAHREFGAPGRAQLLHQHHVELAFELGGDDPAHFHRAAGDREHQRVAAAIGGERLGQAPAGVDTGIENASHKQLCGAGGGAI
jgi:hypothetical protein